MPRLQFWIGPIVLGVLLANIDLGELIEVFRSARARPLWLAYAAFIPTFFIRALRWRLLLGPAGQSLRYSIALGIYANAIFWGTLTPGRVGELTKVWHVRNHGIGTGAAVASVTVERALDLCVLSIIGGSMLFATATAASSARFGMLAGGAVVFLVAFISALISRPVRDAIVRALLWPTPTRLRERLAPLLERVSDSLGSPSPRSVTLAILATLLAWSLNYYSNYLLGEGLQLEIGYASMAGIAALCSVVSLIPISVMGAGTRDATLIVLLATYGIDETRAIALSTLFLSLILWNAILASLAVVASRKGSI